MPFLNQWLHDDHNGFINFSLIEVDAWANHYKRRSLVFYRSLSENQGRVTCRKRQISDKQTVVYRRCLASTEMPGPLNLVSPVLYDIFAPVKSSKIQHNLGRNPCSQVD